MSYSALSHGGVARVSTMVVDAPLDMGGFGIKADRIEESTPAAGVDMPDGIKTDIIEESTAGAGVAISPGKWTSLDLSASDNVRAYNDTTPSIANVGVFTKVKTLTIPSRYTSGQTCRVTTAIKSAQAGVTRYVQVYVNGVPAGAEHSTNSMTYVTFTDDITVSGGDNVEMWVKTGGGGAYLGLFTVRGDDALPDVFFTVGQAWP